MRVVSFLDFACLTCHFECWFVVSSTTLFIKERTKKREKNLALKRRLCFPMRAVEELYLCEFVFAQRSSVGKDGLRRACKLTSFA